MATKLEKLFFAIGVQDAGASSKIAKLQASIEGLTSKAQSHFTGLGTAALGAVGAVMSIKTLVDPAVELNRALGEVGSLGVNDADLAKLQTAAGKFAFEYGGAATDIIRSSYDIQSAIAGLTGKELASFTTAGGILAKATKADTASITNYMGTMYGIYEENARAMGKAAWVEQLAGRTAYAVQIFKTTGAEMSAAFTALGANAQAAGIDAAEQMAVLGTLQSTMGGSEAGTKYKAYLAGIGQAQKELGLKFTDAQGKMLGMPDVLEKIRGKFGDTLTVAQSDQLKKAFGSDEAVSLIKLMLKHTGKLKKDIADIGGIKGMDQAERMAKRQTDAFQRFGAAVSYVRANFMQKLLPTLERWTNKGTAHLETVNKWITKYPNVARVVGYAVLVIASLAGTVAIATLAFHLFALAAMPVKGAIKGVTAVFNLLSGAIRANPLGFLAWSLIMCIMYWDTIQAAIGATWTLLRSFFESLGSFGQPFLLLMSTLEERWRLFTDIFTDFSWTKVLRFAVATALTPLEYFVNYIGRMLSFIPGMGEHAEKLMSWKAANFVPDTAAMEGPELEGLKQSKTLQVQQGGVLASSSSSTVNNSGRSVSIGEQHLHFETPPTSMDDVLAMTYG